uniref:PCFS4-like zinc finger domain-containing protein n=1 Tax=Chlamydomonas leiostraca TaxID=1034604 RepID=A0A7S0S037_9CHLO
MRKRRLDNTAHPVRPWYTTVDQWLQGTRPDTDVSISFFEDEANAGADEAGAKAAAQLEPVEEDPSQPTCAISGEPFERSYDPDTDKWYYDDAVVLRGEQAARYGVMEGSIVKATCLAGAPPPQAAKAGAGAVVQGGASVQAGAAAAQQEQSLAGGVAGTGVLPEKRSSHGEEGGPEQKRPRTTP